MELDAKIIELVLTLILAVITAFLVPWLKQKIGAEKFAEIQEWVTIAVRAAEQIYSGAGCGAEKKSYVVDFLHKWGINYPEERLDSLIESAVHKLNQEG